MEKRCLGKTGHMSSILALGGAAIGSVTQAEADADPDDPFAWFNMGTNLVYFERADLSTYVNIGPDTAPETFTFANNLWYARDNPAQSEPSLPATDEMLIIAPERDSRRSGTARRAQ